MSTTTSSPATELSSGASVAGRAAILLYGVSTYPFFLAVFVYTIGFVGGFVVPKHIENGVPGHTLSAVLVDVVLLALFAIQHSVMARPAFKRWWTQIIPAAAERSRGAARALLPGMGDRLLRHLPDRPLRAVRRAPGGRPCLRRADRAGAV